MPTPKSPPKAKRGFAAMSPELRRAIASAGGKACHRAGKGRPWTPAQAAVAGRKGGKARRRPKIKPPAA